MSEGRPQPYVGISGVARREDHIALCEVALRERIDHLGYVVMIGVQASGKTQVLDTENKRGQDWHPVGNTIAEAATADDSEITKPFIHCFFTDEELVPGVRAVMERAGHYVRGIQFNGLDWMANDYRDLLNRFREAYPGQLVVVQAHNAILGGYSGGR